MSRLTPYSNNLNKEFLLAKSIKYFNIAASSRRKKTVRFCEWKVMHLYNGFAIRRKIYGRDVNKNKIDI